jgi:hypothetical protein
MTSPKSFSSLVGKLKQQKANTEQASMATMKQVVVHLDWLSQPTHI